MTGAGGDTVTGYPGESRAGRYQLRQGPGERIQARLAWTVPPLSGFAGVFPRHRREREREPGQGGATLQLSWKGMKTGSATAEDGRGTSGPSPEVRRAGSGRCR
jgi:hypothetical protein